MLTPTAPQLVLGDKTKNVAIFNRDGINFQSDPTRQNGRFSGADIECPVMKGAENLPIDNFASGQRNHAVRAQIVAGKILPVHHVDGKIFFESGGADLPHFTFSQFADPAQQNLLHVASLIAYRRHTVYYICDRLKFDFSRGAQAEPVLSFRRGGQKEMLMTKVGIAGFGTIGAAVARHLREGRNGMELVAVTSGTRAKAEAKLAQLDIEVPVVAAVQLADMAEIIVECAPTGAFMEIVVPALERGRQIVTVSAAALIENMAVIDIARSTGGRVIMATGALLGLDAVRAAAVSEIFSVTMITRKPPKSLLGAPEVVRQDIDLMKLTEPTLLFDGSARDGARGFPANVNVAAALALAGIGPDRTRLQIWADPSLERNTHFITVDADSARFELKIENIPSVEKPGTGRITALSMIAALDGLTAPLRVGS